MTTVFLENLLVDHKVRQRIALINSFKIFGSTSSEFRRTFYSLFVLSLFLVLAVKQRNDLSHSYLPSIQRVMSFLHWDEEFFAYATDNIAREDRCTI